MRREYVVNKLKELGYKFRRQAWRVQIWSHPQTRHQVQVRQKDDIDDDWVKSMLRQAGCPKEDIEQFFAACTN